MTARPRDTTGAATGRLARLHLRTGLLRLARAELEELAGDGRLEPAEVLDLAEARWRTGDLRGASEAAGAWLDAGAPPISRSLVDTEGAIGPGGGWHASGRARAMAHGLVAEGLTLRGRHEDAAIHVSAALDALRGDLAAEQALLAGVDAADPAVPAASLAAALDGLFAGIPPRAGAWPVFELGSPPDDSADARADAPGARPRADGIVGTAPDPLLAADERLRAGDDAAAAVLLVLALRAAPTLATEILDRADAALASRPDAAMHLARAEALRSLGLHETAGIAYADAEARARGPATDAVPAPASRVPDRNGRSPRGRRRS